MKDSLPTLVLTALCFSMACAVGGGLHEQLVLTPLWSASPPSSFAIIQPETGVPLQKFWIPVHSAVTVFMLLALAMTWSIPGTRRLLLVGLVSYVVMRGWSSNYFIPEMLAFQEVSLDSPPSVELSDRVARWTSLTLWRLPLNVLSFGCFLFALKGFQRSNGAMA